MCVRSDTELVISITLGRAARAALRQSLSDALMIWPTGTGENVVDRKEDLSIQFADNLLPLLLRHNVFPGTAQFVDPISSIF
jgi:hypothetical protein